MLWHKEASLMFKKDEKVPSPVSRIKRQVIVVSIAVLIAAAHILRIGSHLQGGVSILYSSYFSDLVIPFGFYFLFRETLHDCATGLKMPFLGRWEANWAIAFLVPAIAETCQYFGIPVLGYTFDLLDYVMYALGAITAVVVDTQVLARNFDFWSLEKAAR